MACVACTNPAEVDESADLTPNAGNALTVTLAKSSWTWNEVSAAAGSGIQATVRNGSSRSLRSFLGDAFNGATEQADLYLADQSGGGAIEWRDGSGTWQPVSLGVLAEGVKAVTLRPAGSYTLTALLAGPRRTGTFRIRIDYYDDPAGTERQSDYSASFEVR
ncbi:MAG: hypothetical protein AB1762_20240 [Gemmatimonadota bacterium]